MPYKHRDIERVYWDIGMVAEMVHQATSALRFWEMEFEWLNPKKNKKGNRQYTKDDIVIVMQINWLVNIAGMTSKGIKKAKKLGYYDDLLNFYVDKIRNSQPEEKIWGIQMAKEIYEAELKIKQ